MDQLCVSEKIFFICFTCQKLMCVLGSLTITVCSFLLTFFPPIVFLGIFIFVFVSIVYCEIFSVQR